VLYHSIYCGDLRSLGVTERRSGPFILCDDDDDDYINVFSSIQKVLL